MRIAESSPVGMALTKLHAIRRYLNNQMLEREEEIDSSLVALLSGVSCLFLGDAGTGKTKLILGITRFTGLQLFHILITDTTKPESIFGLPDIPALAKGIQRYKIDGYAPTAEVIFFDEIFKAGGIVLNPLLTMLNEKQFRNGDDGMIDVPLVTAFAASNETPTEKGLRPIYDRFLIRHNVEYLKTEDNLLQMMDRQLSTEADAIPEVMTPDEMLMLRRNVRNVEVGDDIRRLVINIRDQVQRSIKIVISDRRIAIALVVLQAQALLKGRQKVKHRDLSMLSHMFWDDPRDAFKVKTICMSSADAIGGDILSYEQLSSNVLDTAIESGDIQGGVRKLRAMLGTMKKFKSGAVRVRNSVRNKLDKLQGILDQRSQYVVLVMNELGGGYWLKLSEGTAQNWTPAQIREMGFKQRRNGGYWYTDMSETALAKRVKKKHNIEITFRDIG